MNELLFFINLLPMILIVIIIAGLIFSLLITLVYFVGYVYDCMFWWVFQILGHIIGRKFPWIKEITLVVKLWKKIQPKKLYLRYETPLFSYCFSFTAIFLLALMLPIENIIIRLFMSAVLYIFFYLIGMNIRCRSNEQYYEKVLVNNMEFLKLSFLPLGFIITIIGFLFTVVGVNLQDVSIDFTMINEIIAFVNCRNDENILISLFRIFIVALIVILSFYIISIPVQLISYFLISIINYFRKHKAAYKELNKKYLKFIKNMFE